MSNLRWSGEQLKATFYFNNNTTYVVSTLNTENNKEIVSASYKGQEQVQYNNLFGSVSSNTLRLDIWDMNNLLDSNNSSSPYYNYMRPGVKVVCQLFKDGVYEDYGTYYVNSWSAPWSNGSQEFVTIEAEDELTYICNFDIPKMPTYTGVRAGVLITNILNKIGIPNSRIFIDDDINVKKIIGVSPNTKLGYFLNDICQELCAIVEIDVHNNIYIMKAMSGYKNRYTLSDGDDIIKVSKDAYCDTPYTRVKLTYYKSGSNRYDMLGGYNKDIDLTDKNIPDISLGNRVQSIAAVVLQQPSTTVDVLVTKFDGYQLGVDLGIDVDRALEDADINIYGSYKKTNDKVIYSNIKYDGLLTTGSTINYEMTSQYAETEIEAQAIADTMAHYIEMLYKKVNVESVIKPSINVGDIININSYNINGNYKVIASEVTFGEEYSHNLTLVPLNTALWDDSETWDDQISWNDYSNTIFS